MERDELLLEYLTKKLSPNMYNSKVEQDCNEFTDLFTGKIDPSDEGLKDTSIREKLRDPTKLGTIMEFERQLNQINCKFPFFHFKSFLEDYTNGVYKSQIVEKYQLTSVKDIQEIVKILKLPHRKEKFKINDITNYARLTNLKNFYHIYNEFIENYDLFKNKIDNVYFSNILKSKLILEIVKGNNIEAKLTSQNITSFKEFDFLNKIILKTLSSNSTDLTFHQLEVYFNTNFNSILKKLFSDSIIKNVNNELVFNNDNFTENKIKTFVIEQITSKEKGISYKQLITLLINEFKYFYYLPHFSILQKIINNLENEQKIKSQKETNPKHGFSERHFFSSIFYKKQIVYSKKEELDKKQFFGRPNVSGTEFVYELERLVRGDLDGSDDQVTRIAGLVLSSNQKIMASSKSNNLFDFSTDVIRYRPTDEEEKLMKDLNFVLKPETEVMHLKIMINEKITYTILEKLSDFCKSSNGINSQVVIISFENNANILDKLPDDRSIQIVDKKQITQWIDLIPTMPCRKGTVVRIMRGSEFRSIGKILRMYYETGTATLEQVGTGNEISCMIGDLEEINLYDQPVDDYILLHNNFFDFLNLLIKLFNHNLVEKNVFEFKVNYDEPRENEYYLDYTSKSEDFNLSSPLSVILCELNSMHRTEIHSRVKIDPSSMNKHSVFKCNCVDFISDISNTSDGTIVPKICKHLIIVLMDIGIINNLFSETWGNDNENPLFACLKKI